MYPIVFHIYGPFALHSFSLLLALGIVFFTWLTLRHPLRSSFIAKDVYLSLITECALAGIAGGRLLHLASEWQNYSSYLEMVSIWNGGLSIFGTLIGVILYGTWFLHRNRLAILPIADIAALYAPLVHAIARIGCLLAGCCYGKPTGVAWAITLNGVHVHPTQMYSALIFLVLFLLLRNVCFVRCSKHGQLAMLYLIGASLERFFVDFLRGDRIINTADYLSLHQWIALIITGIALIAFLIVTKKSNSYKQYAHESL